MPRNSDEKYEMPADPSSHEVGPGPTPGIAEGEPEQLLGDEEEVGPGPTPGIAEGEPDHINDGLMHRV